MNGRVSEYRLSVICFLLSGLLLTCGCLTQLGKFKGLGSAKLETDPTGRIGDAEGRLTGYSESVSLWISSSDAAMQRANRENKLVMAMFTGSDWCPWCVKLEREVFDTPEFRDWANQNAIPLKLDFPKKTKLPYELRTQNEKMLQKYAAHVKAYPSVLFLDSRGEFVAKMGYARGGPEAWISKAEQKLGL